MKNYMRMKGLEPSLLAELEPKSSASTNSATSAFEPISILALILIFCQG